MTEPDEAEKLFQQLLAEAARPSSAGVDLPSALILPQPGFCMKTVKRNPDEEPFASKVWPEGAEKVFLNICHSSKLPDPPDIDEEKLIEILKVTESAEGAEGYRVPMSLGEPHAELDKSGIGCTVYDIVISEGFYKKINENELFMSFFMTVALEGVEDKYKIALSRDCKQLKNKKFMGALPEQNVRTKSKPRISEVQALMKELELREGGKQIKEEQKIKEVTDSPTKPKEPSYVIFKDPPDGHPQFLVVEIKVPGIISAKSLDLAVNEDTLQLSTRSNLFHLDIAYFPFDVVPKSSVAQFNKQTQNLTVTLPVAPLT